SSSSVVAPRGSGTHAEEKGAQPQGCRISLSVAIGACGRRAHVSSSVAGLALRLDARDARATVGLSDVCRCVAARALAADGLRSFAADCVTNPTAACALCLRRRPALYRCVCAI